MRCAIGHGEPALPVGRRGRRKVRGRVRWSSPLAAGRLWHRNTLVRPDPPRRVSEVGGELPSSHGQPLHQGGGAMPHKDENLARRAGDLLRQGYH